MKSRMTDSPPGLSRQSLDNSPSGRETLPLSGNACSSPELPLSGLSQLLQRGLAQEAARSDAVEMQLIAGEFGVGKRSCAAAWHRQMGGSAADLLGFDAAALRPDQLQALLFAETSGPVLLQPHFNGKTVVLAHIERAEASLQALLAQLLRETQPTGERRPRLLLTTTNPSRLWPDLRYRLESHALLLPPLRERRSDLPTLILQLAAASCGGDNAETFDEIDEVLTPQAFEVLQRHAWPGNLLELQAVLQACWREGPLPIAHTNPALQTLERIIQQAIPQPRRSRIISAPTTPETGTAALQSTGPTSAAAMWQHLHSATFWRECVRSYAEELPASAEKSTLMGNITEAVEAGLITAVLELTSGNIAQSARLLGITRVSLRRKIHAFGLNIPHRESGSEKS